MIDRVFCDPLNIRAADTKISEVGGAEIAQATNGLTIEAVILIAFNQRRENRRDAAKMESRGCGSCVQVCHLNVSSFVYHFCWWAYTLLKLPFNARKLKAAMQFLHGVWFRNQLFKKHKFTLGHLGDSQEEQKSARVSGGQKKGGDIREEDVAANAQSAPGGGEALWSSG